MIVFVIHISQDLKKDQECPEPPELPTSLE